MPSPITRSPLKVMLREHATQMTATDPGGAIVLEGVRALIAAPGTAAAVQTTAAGQWTIGRSVGGNAPVFDAAGVPVAEIRTTRRGHHTIATGDGTEIDVGNERFKPWFGVRFAAFGRARAPIVRQSRSFKLWLSDEFLARPDHEMLVAVFAYVARSKIAGQIARAAQSSPTP
jgi:hypothetical protein